MLALSPQLSNLGWLLDDPLRHDHHQFDNSYCLSAVARAFTSDHSNIDLIESPTSQAKSCDLASFCDEFVNQGDASAAATAPGCNIVKKMNHNASERDRRKKINELYSTLRLLLPPQDQSSKLSIPATISRVLKYIPDLQNEVERLEAKKERFMSKVSVQQESSKANQKRTKSTHDDGLSSTAVSATQITNREVIIQISVPKVGKSAVYETIAILEQDGLLLLNATCTDSSQRVFCNLHIQAQGDQAVDAEMVKEKLLAFYEKAQQVHY